jgi:hypothetical protein
VPMLISKALSVPETDACESSPHLRSVNNWCGAARTISCSPAMQPVE